MFLQVTKRMTPLPVLSLVIDFSIIADNDIIFTAITKSLIIYVSCVLTLMLSLVVIHMIFIVTIFLAT